MSELSDLLGALAAFDAPVAPAPLAQPLGPGQLDAQTAIDRVTAMYRELQQQAGRIVHVFGAQIPCEVQDRHNRAVAAYLAVAKSVFDQLAGKNVSVVQTLYNIEGQEVSKVTGLKPVSPMVFAVAGCAGAAQVATADVIETTAPTLAGRFGRAGRGGRFGAFGVWPLVARIVIALIAAGGAALVAREIVVNWPNEHVQVQQAQKVWMDNHLGCVDARVKAGLDAAAADALCRGVAGPAPKVQGTSTLASIGVIAIAITAGLVGGYLLFRATSPGERERRRRIQEAEEEAQRLQTEAKRVRREARAYPRRAIESAAEPALAGSFGRARMSAGASAGVPARFRGCICF